MRIQVELTETDLRRLVLEALCERFPDLTPEDIRIEVKTSKNYKTAEWEDGLFRARLDKTL